MSKNDIFRRAGSKPRKVRIIYPAVSIIERGLKAGLIHRDSSLASVRALPGFQDGGGDRMDAFSIRFAVGIVHDLISGRGAR